MDMKALQDKRISRPKRASSKSSKRRDQFIVVQHHYHDHGEEVPSMEEKLILDSVQQNPLVASFPMKLCMMLEQVEADGNAHIVSWQPHGRCFVVHEPEAFKVLLPKYFGLSKVSSFQRQLNLYDFTRLTRGRDKGGYYNEFFLRDRAHLLNMIQRIKVKGTGVRARSNPEQEPDFWTMEWVGEAGVQTQMTSQASVVSHDEYDDVEVSMNADYASFEEPAVPLEVPVSSSDIQLCGWGKPFYYLEHLPYSEAKSAEQFQLPAAASNMNFLNSLDMDEFMDTVVDVDTDDAFGDLLERVLA
jgi:hypothetical protein